MGLLTARQTYSPTAYENAELARSRPSTYYSHKSDKNTGLHPSSKCPAQPTQCEMASRGMTPRLVRGVIDSTSLPRPLVQKAPSPPEIIPPGGAGGNRSAGWKRPDGTFPVLNHARTQVKTRTRLSRLHPAQTCRVIFSEVFRTLKHNGVLHCRQSDGAV